MKCRQDIVKIIQSVKIPSDFTSKAISTILLCEAAGLKIARQNISPFELTKDSMQYTSQVAISDIPLYLAPMLKPDIAYGSIIPSYIAIGDNFSRGTFTKGLNDFAISGGQRTTSVANYRGLLLCIN